MGSWGRTEPVRRSRPVGGHQVRVETGPEHFICCISEICIFMFLRFPFIEILAAFEFSPNSVEFYRILEFYLQILAEFYRCSNSTFKFWPNSAEFQILPSEFWVKLRAPVPLRVLHKVVFYVLEISRGFTLFYVDLTTSHFSGRRLSKI